MGFAPSFIARHGGSGKHANERINRHQYSIVLDDLRGIAQALFDCLLPLAKGSGEAKPDLVTFLCGNSFDPVQQKQIYADLIHGRIGLAQNRLPVSSDICDVLSAGVADASGNLPESVVALGQERYRCGQSRGRLARGGSRWTQGAGVVKALRPFARLGGRHRTFIETHLGWD